APPWAGSPPPSRLSGSPPPGTFKVHSGARSVALRWGEAYSARTLLQSHCSSSATIMGHEVNTPVPISVWATRMVTLSSGAMVSQALISGTMASRYQGWPWIGAALTLRGKWKPSTMAPPTAAALARKSRRLRSTFDVVSTVAVIARPPLRLQLGCAVNGRPDTPVGAAAADVAHLGVDLRVGRFRAALEERRRRHDLPRLAVAALGHVVLDPCHLYRVRPIR